MHLSSPLDPERTSTFHGTYPDAHPPVESVTRAPFFGREGRLIQTSGLHEADRTWLHLDDSLDSLHVSDAPTDEDVAAARALLMDELLCDFPFVSESDRAHMMGAMILPFVRRLIDGPTPLHLIEAPSPGSGKGLLAHLISVLATGRVCHACSLSTVDDEIRKRLTSELLTGRPIVLLDNVDEKLPIDSASLAAVLTATNYTDRILGESRTVDMSNRAVWLMTANKPRLSTELSRRCVRIRIDPKRDMPWRREGFRHQPIIGYAKRERVALVSAVLTLIQAWIAAGQQWSRASLGSFEEWAGVIGGILENAGIPGFLDDLDAFYQEADEEGTMWREFTQLWWERFVDQRVRAKELNDLCMNHNLMESIRIKDDTSSSSMHAQSVRLGKALMRVKDRAYGFFAIKLVENRGTNGKYYALRYVGPKVGKSIEPFPEAANTDEVCGASATAEDMAAS